MRMNPRTPLAMLSREEHQLRGQLAALRHVRRHQGGIAELPDRPGADLYDGAQEAALGQHRETMLSRLACRSRELAEVRERILGGAYGICADCGGRIPPRRLRALPTATLCVRCQERREAAHPSG